MIPKRRTRMLNYRSSVKRSASSKPGLRINDSNWRKEVKTTKERRELPITDEIAKAIQQYEHQNERRKRCD